jgi:hypothetical protein
MAILMLRHAVSVSGVGSVKDALALEKYRELFQVACGSIATPPYMPAPLWSLLLST